MKYRMESKKWKRLHYIIGNREEKLNYFISVKPVCLFEVHMYKNYDLLANEK